MEKGYVKLWRAINDNELLANDNVCYIVFTKLLTHADRMTGSYRTGRYKLAALCNLPPSTVRDALKRLELTTALRQQTDSKATTIIICNWWKYQQDNDSKPSASRRQTDTKQEREKEREVITNKLVITNTQKTDVEKAISFWEELTGKTFRSLRTNRSAIKRLIDAYGMETVEVAIKASVYYQQKEYRPKIFSFTSMEKKWDELCGWIETDKKSNRPKGVRIS